MSQNILGLFYWTLKTSYDKYHCVDIVTEAHVGVCLRMCGYANYKLTNQPILMKKK